MESVFANPLDRTYAGAEGEPLQFDYQERTGYPLAVEERIVTLAEAAALVEPALRRPVHEAGPNKPLLDWQEIRDRLELDAPDERKFVRVVRSFSDQAVYVKEGFALLPDPSKPDQPVSPSDFNVSVDCEPTSSPSSPSAASHYIAITNSSG